VTDRLTSASAVIDKSGHGFSSGGGLGPSYYVAAVTVEVVSRARVDDGAFVDRLACHPVLPLVAGQESEESWSTSFRRPAVHVWDCGGGQLRELGTISAADRGRSRWGFALSWEPGESLLLAANYEITGTAGAVARWTPAGVAGLDGLPPTEGYTYMEFSPDGRALWASPSAGDRGQGGSDIVDLASGASRRVSGGTPGWRCTRAAG
jgi:hypothetical protein